MAKFGKSMFLTEAVFSKKLIKKPTSVCEKTDGNFSINSDPFLSALAHKEKSLFLYLHTKANLTNDTPTPTIGFGCLAGDADRQRPGSRLD